MGANLKKDLGAEDYELDTICMGLDKVFDASLDLIEFRNLETVGAMIDYIGIHKNPKLVKIKSNETTIFNPTGK